MTLPVFIVITIVMMAVGVPIAISLTLPGIFYLILNEISLDIVIQRMFTGMNSMTLLCIPFFILAGEIMGKGGIADRLIVLAKSVIGGVKGGLAYVAIVACAFFAAVTGSGIACCITLGAILIPDMIRSGYSRDFSTGVISSASIMGPIIPPSISLVVYGTLTGASIADLYLVGIPAGLLMAVVFCIVAFFKCRNEKSGNYIVPRNEDGSVVASVRPPFLKSLVSAVWALGAPVIILGGILSGVVTPTEASVVAVLYSLLVSFVFYRQLKWRELPAMLLSTAKSTAKIYIIIASATLFAWILTYENLPQTCMNAMLGLTDNPTVMLLIFNLIFLIMGMFMESSSMYVIAIPMFLPILKAMDIDLVYFGVLISVNAAIGLITPPFGTCLFSGASVGKVPIHRLIRQIMPFCIAQIGLLLVLTFFPQLIMWIV